MKPKYAYNVMTYCEVDKRWTLVYRQSKGDLFNSLKGCKAFISRENKMLENAGFEKRRYKIVTYRLDFCGEEEIL